MDDTLPAAIKLYRGVSIYRVAGSQFWYVRVWDRENQRYIVKSTGEASPIKAKAVAQSHALSMIRQEQMVEKEYTFKYYALKLLNETSAMAVRGERNRGYVKALHWAVQNEDWGLIRKLGLKDVRKISTRDYREYLDDLTEKRPELSSSTKNTIMAAFRNVMKIAREDGAIDLVPETPRSKQRDNPRPFFRFHPLVAKADDGYRKVRAAAMKMAKDGVVIRGLPVTGELYDLIIFIVNSFVRPISSELFALKHSDVTVAKDPQRLILVVRNGKTGFRSSNTMEGAVGIYQRIQRRYPDAGPDDYLFLPQYRNRETAGKIIQRQFKMAMELAGVEDDIHTNQKHTIYSLRHTALCMRIILSHGDVNIYNLAKNAGTSVDQIERFYARHLPLSRELAINLQSFGKKV